MSAKLITVLRWLAILPGSLLFVLVGCLVLHFLAILKFYFYPTDESNFLGFIQFGSLRELEYAMYALFNPAIFILSAVFIAPCKKLIVAYIIAVMEIFLLTTIGILIIFKVLPIFSGVSIRSYIFAVILNLISIAVAIAATHMKENDV